MRLIDADALIPMMKYATTDSEVGIFPIKIGFDAIEKVIDKAPTIEERKTGRWNVYCHTPKDFSYSCNQCGYSAPYGLYGGEYSQKKWNFCPNCGARMEVENRC